MKPYALGLAAVTIGTIALSTAGLMTRLVTVDAPTLLFVRGVAAGLALLVGFFIISRGRALDGFLSLGWSGLLISVTSAICAALFIGSLYMTSVAHVAIIFATCPFIAAALGYMILGERPSRSALVASSVALVGVVLMVGSGEEGNLLGDLMALAMTTMIALWTILLRRFPEKPAVTCTILSCFLSAALALPFASPMSASHHDLVVVLGFGVLVFSLGFVLLTVGAKNVPPVEAALIGALDAPLAPFWVWLAIGYEPALSTVLGGVIVLIAVCVHVAAIPRVPASSLNARAGG